MSSLEKIVLISKIMQIYITYGYGITKKITSNEKIDFFVITPKAVKIIKVYY